MNKTKEKKYFYMAKPVWAKGLSEQINCCMDLECKLRYMPDTELCITGATFFQIFMNGSLIHYGPARVALSYLQNGAGGSVTKTELFDVAEVRFKEILKSMSVGINLVDVSAAGYDESGKAVYFTTKIIEPNAVANVSVKSNCDVNGDGVIDLLDITYCQKYYRKGEISSDWNDFKHCDLDGTGIIDIQDLIIILKAM